MVVEFGLSIRLRASVFLYGFNKGGGFCSKQNKGLPSSRKKVVLKKSKTKKSAKNYYSLCIGVLIVLLTPGFG
jgi:hypothetical protein